MYDDAGWFVRLGQCSAVMEVLHSLLGLVRSPVLTALMQWAGRTHAIMAVIHPIESLHGTTAAFDVFGVVHVGGHTLSVVQLWGRTFPAGSTG